VPQQILRLPQLVVQLLTCGELHLESAWSEWAERGAWRACWRQRPRRRQLMLGFHCG
jgi:hypothetical protein